jgi:4-carboxymuconolactone decarboxylase
MARIPYPTAQDISARAQEFLSKLAPINIFRMMSHSDHLLEPFVRLGNGFLSKGTLDPVLREIAILRVGYLSGSSYETFQHERIGRRLGMSEALIAAVRQGAQAEGLSTPQRQVLSYVDDLVKNVRASDQTFEPLRQRLSVKELQELTLVTGYYMMVCRFLETFGIEIEQADQNHAQSAERQERQHD